MYTSGHRKTGERMDLPDVMPADESWRRHDEYEESR